MEVKDTSRTSRLLCPLICFYRVCTLERVLVSFNAGFTVTVDFSIHCFIDEKFMVCTPHRLQCKAPHFPKHKFPIHTGRWLGLGGQQQ